MSTVAEPMYRKRIGYQAGLLGGFATLAAALLILGNNSTYEAIAERQAEDLLESLSQVIPGSLHDNNLLDNAILIDDATGQPLTVYRALKEQQLTGLAYAAGSGVPQDFATAYRWLWIAADHGSEKAGPYRDRIGDRLTEDRRAAARAAAQRWTPRGAQAATGFDDGPSVAFAQYTLAKLGFDPGVVDGKYGPRTRGAVEAYETAQGVPVTGAMTRDLLMRLKNDPIHAS